MKPVLFVRPTAAALLAAVLFAAFASLASAQNAQPTLPPPDVVRDGIVLPLQPSTHEGLPLFKKYERAYLEEFASRQWFMLAQLRRAPAILDNPKTAIEFARAFLPVNALDEYFVCTVAFNKPCSVHVAGTTAYQRANDPRATIAFKGNEIERPRNVAAFANRYRAALVAVAPSLPAEVFYQSFRPLGPYNAKEGVFRTHYGEGGAPVFNLAPGYCARMGHVVTLPMNEDAASALINRIEAASPQYPARTFTMLAKVRIDDAVNAELARGVVTGECQSSAEVVRAQMYAGLSLKSFVMDLPLYVDPSAKAAQAAARPPPAAIPAPAPTAQAGKAPEPAARTAPAARAATAIPELVGVRIGMSAAEAEKIVRKSMPVSLAYRFEAEKPAYGYPKGMAFISFDKKEMVRIFIGEGASGAVIAVDRLLSADGLDLTAVQNQFVERFDARSRVASMNPPECTSKATGKRSRVNVELVEGALPVEADRQQFLKIVNPLQVRPALGAEQNVGACQSMVGMTTYSSAVGPLLHVMLYDHSKAFVEAPPPPPRTIKF